MSRYWSVANIAINIFPTRPFFSLNTVKHCESSHFHFFVPYFSLTKLTHSLSSNSLQMPVRFRSNNPCMSIFYCIQLVYFSSISLVVLDQPFLIFLKFFSQILFLQLYLQWFNCICTCIWFQAAIFANFRKFCQGLVVRVCKYICFKRRFTKTLLSGSYRHCVFKIIECEEQYIGNGVLRFNLVGGLRGFIFL